MHVGRSYSVLATIHWTRRRACVLLLLSLLPVLAYDTLGLAWVALPWQVAGLLGTAAAFIVGFKNAQTYNRTMEALHVWNAIQFLSRYWATICRDLPKRGHAFEALVRRHLAWLAVLRHQAREPRVWETTDLPTNSEFRRRNQLVVPERATPLADELASLLSADELARLGTVHAKATWLIGEQSRTARALYESQDLAVLHHVEMQKTLKELLDQQARVERLKDFPYPRQYAVINKIFVWAFAAVMPFCLLREFDQLHMTWAVLPFSTMLSWLYVALDQVGENTENPFEGGANDVPITHISRVIEADLRQLLGEPDVPPPTLRGPYAF